MEPAFENAGESPGVEIWRIENFKPVPYPKNDYGKFYSGDSYIVLYTKEKNGVKSWDIHFWLGSETSQDEAGTAAILSVQLDDHLGGNPVQYREVQDHESQIFLSHFKSGIRYVPGGIVSGFHHVDRDEHDKYLYQIKGKRNIRVKQVDLTITSMNKGDCFVLDVGSDVYAYIGSKAKRAERIKAIAAANQIRDQDNGGRSKVHIIDEFSTHDEYTDYFNALGEGTPEEVPDETQGGDDEEFEKKQESLYRISNASGEMEIEELTEKPLLQSMLDTNDCFILDTSDSNLYVWVGKNCNNLERSDAMVKAEYFIKHKNYPSWTSIQRVVENGEPSSFRQYFKSWKEPEDQIRHTQTKPQLERKSEGAAPEFMPDDGSGTTEIYRVEDFELTPISEENYGKFFGGDSYVIKYECNGRYIIYIWQGNESSNDEKASSAIHAVKMDDELNGKAIQIRVVQDEEPKHFLNIFKGKLIIFLGGKASGFKNLKDHDTYVHGETRMFRIRGTNEFDVRASQQIPAAKSLESDDVFLIENDSNVWIWQGKHCDDVEKGLATNFAGILTPDAEPVIIEEGEEPEEFWEALGGKDNYIARFEEAVLPPATLHLYHGVIKNNNLKLELISDFEQGDLVEDDVMILDTGMEVYVWIGKGADDVEKKLSLEVAQKYLKKHKRNKVPIIVIKQGQEPEVFTALFPMWSEDLWENQQSYESLRSKFGN